MDIAKPLGRTGRSLLQFLGISRGTDAFLTGMNREVQPVINVSGFLATENLSQLILTNSCSIGPNYQYTNTTTETQIIYAISSWRGALAAGVSAEIRPCMIGDAPSAQVIIALGPSDFANPTEWLLSGGEVFSNPIPLLPGWSVGCFVSTLSGAANVNVTTNVVIAS